MTYTTVLPPTQTRPKSQLFLSSPTEWHRIDQLLRLTFHPTTLLLIGALLQGTLLLFQPHIICLFPTILVLLARIISTLTITLNLRANPYLEGVVPRTTTILPDANGTLAGTAASEKVAVLLLGVKFNHPMGILAPNAKPISDFAMKMATELDEGAPYNGFLGQSSWNTTDARGAPELVLISFWRSIEDIHDYSQGPLHREAWTWWDTMVRKDAAGMRHLGINHEILEAPRNRWESLYVNFQPTRLGATSYLRKGDKLMGGTIDDQWISPIVEARRDLRTSNGRLGWAANMRTGGK